MIEIREVTAEEAPPWTSADRSLSVERTASLPLVNNALVTAPQSVPRYTKTYEADCPPEADCFVASSGTRALGEVRASLHWNGYLYIHDLVLGEAHRGNGVGAAT